MNKERKKKPDTIVVCHKCNKKYPFDDFEMLDNVDISTSYRKVENLHIAQFKVNLGGVSDV